MRLNKLEGATQLINPLRTESVVVNSGEKFICSGVGAEVPVPDPVPWTRGTTMRRA